MTPEQLAEDLDIELGELIAMEAAVVLLSTIHNYTLSCVMEERLCFRVRRCTRHNTTSRRERRSSIKGISDPAPERSHSFEEFDPRFKEGLNLILYGARVKRTAVINPLCLQGQGFAAGRCAFTGSEYLDEYALVENPPIIEVIGRLFFAP